MFFYTDQLHNVVAIRFRKPYSKEFRLFKPTALGGVFNHGLFSPSEMPSIDPVELLVFEGEFNVLQYQSLNARIAESMVEDPPRVTVTGTTNLFIRDDCVLLMGLLGAPGTTLKSIL